MASNSAIMCSNSSTRQITPVNHRHVSSIHFVVLLLWLAGSLSGAEVDYVSQIKPILAEKCFSCHGALKQEADLRLETRTLMVQGGDSGPVIIPGHPEESLLFERINSHGDDRMPPMGEGSAATPDQINLIRQWILDGANAPEEALPLGPKQHWAFQPVIPHQTADGARWTTDDHNAVNPIDRLLGEMHAEKKIRTVAPAERPILLRRLYLDLIGLPPTTQQLRDTRSIPVIVDELLANPQHGERWARHWMDVWRYSDWYGLGKQLRFSQKHLWHWRDWIVSSLNQDKGYDRMVLEMLAGDEIAPTDEEAVAATGYLARNYYLFNRTTWLDSTIEHTSKAFLGLTINCAKCHDHKYDPITQLDYYRLRAIFEPHQIRLDPIAGETDFEKAGLPRAFDDHIDQATYLHRRGDPKDPDTQTKIEPGVPQILSNFASPIEPVQLPLWAYAPGSREYVQQDHLKQAETNLSSARSKLAEAEERYLAVASAPTTPATSKASFKFEDAFDELNPDHWQLIGEGWKLEDGRLLQTVSTRETQIAKLRRTLPRDFDLRCRYTTTGGSTYKSVTIRFDQQPQGGYANYVYTSAHAPGPKVQVAYERNGSSNYPSQGRIAQPIETGRSYELRFAVRDTLVNVWLDGKFLIAYQYPDRRDGFLSLSGFDATVAFDSIQITSLDPAVALTDTGKPNASSIEETEKAVTVAKAELNVAIRKLEELKKIIQAERGKTDKSVSVEVRNEQAAAAFGQQLLRQIAELELQREVATGDAKKVQQIENTLISVREKLSKAKHLDENYRPIRASKKALESPAHKEEEYPATYSPVSTGRRLALARWIVSKKNPLTARVAVNHVWMRHFGTPLVESVFDFGLRAKEPTQKRLLDFLAWEFMQSGWSFGHLHRMIVNSKTYQRSTSSLDIDSATKSTDPSNRFYWRMNARRMESQVIRDSLLVLAGELDTSMGGPSIPPSDAARRRSLYFQHSRDQKLTFLEVFDNADILQCYRRSESIIPQQALALSNSRLAIEMSERIAKKMDESTSDSSDAAFVKTIFFALLGRDPTASELLECEDFLDKMNGLSTSKESSRSRMRFVQAMLNHNDFITIR